MIEKYISINRTLRAINQTVREIMDAYHFEGNESFAIPTLITVTNRQLSDLERLWPGDLDKSTISEIGTTLASDKTGDYWRIINELLPDLEDKIDNYISSQPYSNISYTILDLLHPKVTSASYQHFKLGNYRESVLNSVVAVFDLIRERTGIDKDGQDLVGEVFSLANPILIVSTLQSESGKSDQKGFIQLLNGVYQGVRNPKAHTLTINPTELVAGQYLVFSSLLCRRVEEATINENG